MRGGGEVPAAARIVGGRGFATGGDHQVWRLEAGWHVWGGDRGAEAAVGRGMRSQRHSGHGGAWDPASWDGVMTARRPRRRAVGS